jgi:diguanylate cyclase (GGDEF)-like protein
MIKGQQTLVDVVNEALNKTLKHYDSKNVYYVERADEDVTAVYQWSNQGNPSLKDRIKLKDKKEFPNWLLEECSGVPGDTYSVFRDLGDSKIGVLAVAGVGNGEASLDFLKTMIPLISEIVFLMKQNKEYEFLSYHDQKTGLLNKNSYLDSMDELDQTELASLGVVSANINNIKGLNKEYGWDYGDEIIIRVGEIIDECFKGDLAFRIGGDEFLVIASNIPYEKLMKKIHDAQSFIEDIGLDLVALGYSWKQKNIVPESSIVQAQEMMHNEKKKYLTRNQKKRHIPIIKSDLLEDIERENFIVCLIPKLDAYSGRIVGAESVVRYHHKDLGTLHPEKYIKLIEETNLSSYLDLYIFEEVCKTLRKWDVEGYNMLPIAVNFSPSTLRQEDIDKKLMGLIEKYHISCEYLEVEMSGFVGDLNQEMLAEISHKLRKLNLRVTLDNFGRKDSSFLALSLMAFDSLKLDPEIIEDIVVNSRNQVIVRGIIEMCKALGATVVADGIETKDQLNVLKEYGCDFVQGTYFNKPIAIETFQTRYMEK